MKKQSAGILMYRKTTQGTEVFLVHPGGPFFAKKDGGVWSIPKGEYEESEDAFEAAKREFKEETGHDADGACMPLAPVQMKSGKIVHAWALEGDIDAQNVRSNSFEMEWPPHSGKKQAFPEVDRGEWFSLPIAKEKIHPAQVALLEELEAVTIIAGKV